MTHYVNAYGVGLIGTNCRFFTGHFILSNNRAVNDGKHVTWKNGKELDLNGTPDDYKAQSCHIGKPFGDSIFVFGKKKLYFVHEEDIKPVKVSGTSISDLFQGIFNLCTATMSYQRFRLQVQGHI